MSDEMMQAMARRLDALETQLAYQDQTIEELNQTVIEQWKQIDGLTQRLARLGDKLEAIEAAPPVDRPPPHY